MCPRDADATLVCSVTVLVAAPAPAGVMVTGDTVQSELAGAPVQVIDVVVVKPPLGVSVMVVEAGLPCATVVLAGERLRPKSDVAAALMVIARPEEVEPAKVIVPGKAAVMLCAPSARVEVE